MWSQCDSGWSGLRVGLKEDCPCGFASAALGDAWIVASFTSLDSHANEQSSLISKFKKAHFITPL